jgi:hypothetical protein
MNRQHTTMPRLTFIIEDEAGTIATAYRDESEAREAGETLAEFDPDRSWYMHPYTLH